MEIKNKKEFTGHYFDDIAQEYGWERNMICSVVEDAGIKTKRSRRKSLNYQQRYLSHTEYKTFKAWVCHG